MNADTRNPSPSATNAAAGTRRRRWTYLVPIAVFAVLVVVFAIGLTLKPRELPSPLIGKAVPEFALPPVEGRNLGLSSADVVNGEVSLVNFFASWCVACRVEHPVFVDLQARGVVPIYGINYKDPPEDAARWLAQYGDPYTRSGADVDGRVGIEWGVYGMPETFLIDLDGRIAYKHIGPISPEFARDTLVPMIERLRATGTP